MHDPNVTPRARVAPPVGGMSSAHRRFVFVEQGIGAGIFNLVVNGAIAWLVFRGAANVPLWGAQSIAGDTMATAFLLPVITGFIVTPLARRRVRGETLAALDWTYASHPRLRALPRTTVRRALALGALSAATIAPLTIVVLWLSGVTTLPFGSFVIFKAAFAGLLAAVVTPVVAIWAITPAVESGESRA